MRSGKIIVMAFLSVLGFLSPVKGFGQSTEAQQLILNVEKLGQLKNILQDMKKGYSIVSNGYNAVKNISKGNFSLHEAFLDGLMLVSPEVRRYARITDILTAQKDIVSEYRRASKNFSASGLMNSGELAYISRIYSALFDQSRDNLDELALVLTAGSLRMSDEERLSAIDRIFKDTSDKLLFMRSFNRQAGMLLLQRKGALADVQGSKDLFKNN